MTFGGKGMTFEGKGMTFGGKGMAVGWQDMARVYTHIQNCVRPGRNWYQSFLCYMEIYCVGDLYSHGNCLLPGRNW